MDLHDFRNAMEPLLDMVYSFSRVFLTCFHPGAVILVGILLFVKKKAGLTERFAMETKDGMAGWSLALSSAGGTIGLLAGVSMGISLFCKTKEYDDEEENAEKSHEYWQQKHKEVNWLLFVLIWLILILCTVGNIYRMGMLCYFRNKRRWIAAGFTDNLEEPF